MAMTKAWVFGSLLLTGLLLVAIYTVLSITGSYGKLGVVPSDLRRPAVSTKLPLEQFKKHAMLKKLSIVAPKSSVTRSLHQSHIGTLPSFPSAINSTKSTEPCMPKNLGPIFVAETKALFLQHPEVLTRFEKPSPGGLWRPPSGCRAFSRTAVILPYRNRAENLEMTLPHLHFFLQQQLLEYGIFVVEQADKKLFNRAKLINIGFTMASKLTHFDCYIVHDLDKLPEDTRHTYRCDQKSPRHMINRMRVASSKNKKYIRGMLYTGFFGGVCAMTLQQFKRVNGMSNQYWGWGREDDDLSARLRSRGMYPSYSHGQTASYVNLAHASDVIVNKHPWPYGHIVQKEMVWDGLSNLNYSLRHIESKPLYTWILVDL